MLRLRSSWQEELNPPLAVSATRLRPRVRYERRLNATLTKRSPRMRPLPCASFAKKKPLTMLDWLSLQVRGVVADLLSSQSTHGYYYPQLAGSRLRIIVTSYKPPRAFEKYVPKYHSFLLNYIFQLIQYYLQFTNSFNIEIKKTICTLLIQFSFPIIRF